MKRILTLSVLFFHLSFLASAAEPFIVFQHEANTLSLNNPTIGLVASEHSCVQIAARNLCDDFRKVCGTPASLSVAAAGSSVAGSFVAAAGSSVAGSSVAGGSPASTILIGTVGTNAQIDRWVKQGELKDLKGRCEKYIIKTIGQQLVIAGSDKRGTVYGIYELSQQLGVSPWYWWADAPVTPHEQVFVKTGEYTDGEPAVRWRGLFLNDEAPCLTTWVKNTWGTNYGDHRFYERVFELILRLKGNFLWPAMWSWAFYADDPLNSKTADDMGILMGTSHHEPMARNHQEYARRREEWGPWNYQTNQQRLDQFFREGIERMKGTDDIVTIGMRGDGDEAMSEDADTRLLQRIVDRQRRIIKEVTGRPAKETPQVWALYKEVLDYYDKGMRVPDDVTILLCDDNWGNIRRVPTTEKERRHPGGWGMYYHVDYVGAPRNTKWLNVTQTQQMFEQLSLAYDHGIQRLWILNVGDLKPMEYPIQLFMDMAWNPKAYTVQTVTDHTRRFFASTLGDSSLFTLHSSLSTLHSSLSTLHSSLFTLHSSLYEEAAAIYNQNCQYMARVTPEMLDANTYNIETGEWKQVADDYARLEARALRLYEGTGGPAIPAAARDFYRQLILFPVQAMANIYDMYYAQAMNHYLARQNDPDANLWADRVAEAFRRDSLLCAAYNNDIAGGKWRGMMTQKHIGYTSWNDDFPADRLPAVQRVAASAAPSSSSVASSSAASSVAAPSSSSSVASSAASSVASPSSASSVAAPAASSVASPSSASSVAAPSAASSVAAPSAAVPSVAVLQQQTEQAAPLGGYTFAPSTGFIAMEAEHCWSATATEGTQWTVYPYYGRTRSAVALTPYTAPVGDAQLRYRFTLPDATRQVAVHVVVKSTLDFLNLGGHAYTVSLDGGEAQTVNFNKTLVDRQPYMYSEFYPAVARRIVEKVVTLPVGSADADGTHTLTLHPCHPGIVFEKIVVDAGGYQPAYLFGTESPKHRK